MACYIKSIVIENVNGGVVNFGNIFKACPRTEETGITGSGSGNLGKCIKTSTKISIVNVCGKKKVKVIDEIGDGFD